MTHHLPRQCRLLAVVASGALVACSSSTNTVPASFSAPTGLALAGESHDRLFIANSSEDTLQVGQLTADLKTFDLMRGDALHFPLRIEAGPQPAHIAATPDGKYVVVLNGGGETVRLIDANALVPASANGKAVVTTVGPSGAVPADLVAAPVTSAAPNGVGCTAPGCSGRFYVSLSGTGAVMAVDAVEQVDATSGAAVPSLSLARVYPVGGTPVSLAVHPNGRLLFVTDSSSNSVVRLDLESGQVLERLDVGDAPGALTVSNDGAALVVARPRLKDLVVFTDLETARPALLDADPSYTPFPTCVDPCNAIGSVCMGEHPSDAAICTTGSAIQEVPGRSYEAVYLGSMTSRLVALGAGPGGTAGPYVSIACGGTTTQFEQAIVAGLSSGNLVYVGLRRQGATGITPEILSTTSCNAPTVTTTNKSVRTDIPAATFDTVLGPCPAAPDRKRFVCTGTPGVVVFPGVSGSTSWVLDWEGVLLERGTGGVFEALPAGTPDNELPFAFSDTAQDLAGSVEVGDILQIVTQPRVDPSCTLSSGTTGPACWLEWRVLAVDTSTTPTRLILARRFQTDQNGISTGVPNDISLGCFVEDGTIAYRIRAGGKYLLSGGNDKIGRAGKGDVVGLGAALGGTRAVLFQLAGPDVPATEQNTCSFYDSSGAAVDTTLRPYFSRSNAFGFTVGDTFSQLVAGSQYGTTTLSGGALPGDMLLVQLPGGPVELFVTFTAGDSLLGYEPFDLVNYKQEGKSRVIR